MAESHPTKEEPPSLGTFAAEMEANLEADKRPAGQNITVADLRNFRQEIINAARGSLNE